MGTVTAREFGKKIEDSTQITMIGYEATEQTLTVTFKSGSTYEYYEVPTQIAHAFLQAESVGSFFHRNIRSKPYRYKKIETKNGNDNGETSSL